MTRKKAAKKTTIQKELRAVIKAFAELLDAYDTAPRQVHEALNAAGRDLLSKIKRKEFAASSLDPDMPVEHAITCIRILHAAAEAALAEQA
jgi:hypothetical protein